MQRYGSTSIRPNGGWSSSGIQNMQASMGQYSMQAGEPAQPVQQSVVIARIRGFFLREAFPSPTDIGQCLSTRSYIFACPLKQLRLPSVVDFTMSDLICSISLFAVAELPRRRLHETLS